MVRMRRDVSARTPKPEFVVAFLWISQWKLYLLQGKGNTFAEEMLSVFKLTSGAFIFMILCSRPRQWSPICRHLEQQESRTDTGLKMVLLILVL